MTKIGKTLKSKGDAIIDKVKSSFGDIADAFSPKVALPDGGSINAKHVLGDTPDVSSLTKSVQNDIIPDKSVIKAVDSEDYLDNVVGGSKGVSDTGKKLVPGEGKIGTYKDLVDDGVVGDNLTPHHAPSDKYMKKFDVSKKDGLSINMEQPQVGGRHRMTDTYGRNMTDAEKSYYYSLSPRDALAYDIKNLRNIYKNEGLYKEMLPSLRQYAKEYIDYMPNIFGKGTK